MFTTEQCESFNELRTQRSLCLIAAGSGSVTIIFVSRLSARQVLVSFLPQIRRDESQVTSDNIVQKTIS